MRWFCPIFVIICHFFSINEAVDSTCIQRAFGKWLDEEGIDGLTVAFSAKNRKKAVPKFVATIENTTTRGEVEKMSQLFQRRLAFVENLARNFFKSIKKHVSDDQIAQLHARFSEDQKAFGCDLARTFSDLYDFLSSMFSTDPPAQQRVQAAANRVLQRFRKSNKTLDKLINNMSFFLNYNNLNSTTKAPTNPTTSS